MTIQAYQTLYESSIAYGMRKALQAEQGNAEKLIKIQNIEDECADLEEEVDLLKVKIANMLKEQEEEKGDGEQVHLEDVAFFTSENKKYMDELTKILTTFEEIKKDEDEDEN